MGSLDRDKFRQQKLTLVEQALQSNYTRKRLHRVTISQLVNRLLLLFQKPRIFLFYHKQVNGWRYIFGTYRDLLYENIFEEAILDKLHIKTGKRKSELLYRKPDLVDSAPGNPADLWPDQPAPIGNTDFGVILVSAIPKTKYSLVSFGSVDISEYDLLEELWRNFLDSDLSKTLGVEERLKARFYTLSQEPDSTNSWVFPVENKLLALNEEGKEFVQEQVKLATGIFEGLYKDLSGTPLVCNKGKIPPNIFFYLRYYDEAGTVNRFKNGVEGNTSAAYPYSLKIIIPELQREHLSIALRNIAKAENFSQAARKSGCWVYQYDRMEGYDELFVNTKDHENEKHSFFKNKALDAEFWQLLKAGDFESILDDLDLPFGKGRRSFVDPVLMSGCTHYRPALFDYAGLERVNKKTLRKGVGHPDNRRFAHMHYLLSAASPESDEKSLGIMTVPLFVGGHAYAAISRATVMTDSKIGAESSAERESWFKNYHFFTDVGRHCVRRLRYRTKSIYKEQLGVQLQQAFELVFDIQRSKYYEIEGQIRIPFRDAQKRINSRFQLLCRVWPYPLVKIEFYQGDIEHESTEFYMFEEGGEKLVLKFRTYANPYYSSESEEQSIKVTDYLSDMDVHSSLSTAMRRVESSYYMDALAKRGTA